MSTFEDIFGSFTDPSASADSSFSPNSHTSSHDSSAYNSGESYGYDNDLTNFLAANGVMSHPNGSVMGSQGTGSPFAQLSGQYSQGGPSPAHSANSPAFGGGGAQFDLNSPAFGYSPNPPQDQATLMGSPGLVSPPTSAYSLNGNGQAYQQQQQQQQQQNLFSVINGVQMDHQQQQQQQMQQQLDFVQQHQQQQQQFELQARAQQAYEATLRAGMDNRAQYNAMQDAAALAQSGGSKKRKVSQQDEQQQSMLYSAHQSGAEQPIRPIAQRTAIDLISNAAIAQQPNHSSIYRASPPQSNQQLKAEHVSPPPTASTTGPKLSKAAEKKAATAAKKAAAAAATAASAAAAAASVPPSTAPGGAGKTRGHNAVERRYRNNINNAIATLRDIVPALRHLKPLPSMPASRRRASQFTLSTAAQAPTPAGLIDGIPAAKTLSKGVILGKAIEYISFLQGAREDREQDLDLFKALISETLGQQQGQAIAAEFDKRRAVREAEREVRRARERKEQAILDGEDSDEAGDEEEEGGAQEPDSDSKPSSAGSERAGPTATAAANQASTQRGTQQYPKGNAQQQQQSYTQNALAAQQQLDSLSQLRDQLLSTGTPLPPALTAQLDALIAQGAAHAFPPSPVSSDELGISPRHMMGSTFSSQAPPRMYLATFLGIAFTGGAGYDLAYSAEAASQAGASAWTAAGGSGVPNASASGQAAGASPLARMHPSLASGLVSLGLAAVVALAVFLVYPLLAARSVAPLTPKEAERSQSRSAYRQRRRAQALATLAQLNKDVVAAPTYAAECAAALKARRELLRLVGAPTLALLPALAKEALATALRKVTTIRVGSFSRWPEADRIEAAVAWVRIAEIEASVPGQEIHFLARAYTFLRLFNLSRSASWPTTTSSVARPSVDALLAIHLATLGQPLSASALWSKATKADLKKKEDTTQLAPWVEIALGADFAQVKAILNARKEQDDQPQPSDTVPLLKISEARCQAALRETWAKLFVAVVEQTTATAVSTESGNVLAKIDTDDLEDTLDQVLASTAAGPVQSLARLTQALVEFYSGEEDSARDTARDLALEAKEGGPITRLACAASFFELVLEDRSLATEAGRKEPLIQVDVLASATIGWLVVRAQNGAWVAASAKEELASSGSTTSTSTTAAKPFPALHGATLAVRRLLGHEVFGASDLAGVCSTASRAALGLDEEEAQSTAGQKKKAALLDLEGAQDACVEALTRITRRAAGLKAEDDSGVELSD